LKRMHRLCKGGPGTQGLGSLCPSLITPDLSLLSWGEGGSTPSRNIVMVLCAVGPSAPSATGVPGACHGERDMW
jgi:hypothetical protein